jgi:hypothetical protein
MRKSGPFTIRDLIEEALRTAAPAVNMNKVRLGPVSERASRFPEPPFESNHVLTRTHTHARAD